jgi:hypothetical protein
VLFLFFLSFLHQLGFASCASVSIFFHFSAFIFIYFSLQQPARGLGYEDTATWSAGRSDGDSSSSGLGSVGRGTRQWLGICNGTDWKHGFMDWVSPVGLLMMEIGIL